MIKISEEVNTLLDDHIVLTQQFSFSPYKGPFEERIADWERKLRLTQVRYMDVTWIDVTGCASRRCGLAPPTVASDRSTGLFNT